MCPADQQNLTGVIPVLVYLILNSNRNFRFNGAFLMSDWDVLAPVEVPNSNDEEGDVLFRPDGDDDSFGGESVGSVSDSLESPFQTEPASFNPQEHRLRRGRNPNPYADPSHHSYTERKLHLGGNFGNKGRNRRGSFQRRNRDGSEQNTASHELLGDGGFDPRKYAEFHDSAIAQRASAGNGKSTEMNSLYYFWCYYLRKAFDREMYDEFLRLAREDVASGSHYGIECFFRLCSYGLETRWDPAVFEDFEREALLDHERGSYYGLEKVKSFLVHNRHEFEIPLLPEIETILAQFPTLESFKGLNGDRSEERKGPRRMTNEDGYPHRSPRSREMSRGGRRRGGHQDGDGSRPSRGGRGRGKQSRFGGEPGRLEFGRMQAASAPADDPPIGKA